MAQLLRVAQLGHPVLRQKTERLADFDEPTLQQLIDDMLVTVVEEAGVGLAAPQVYEAKRFVCDGYATHGSLPACSIDGTSGVHKPPNNCIV